MKPVRCLFNNFEIVGRLTSQTRTIMRMGAGASSPDLCDTHTITIRAYPDLAVRSGIKDAWENEWAKFTKDWSKRKKAKAEVRQFFFELRDDSLYVIDEDVDTDVTVEFDGNVYLLKGRWSTYRYSQPTSAGLVIINDRSRR